MVVALRFIIALTLLVGCKQLLGFESPAPADATPRDSPQDTTVDTSSPDAVPDAPPGSVTVSFQRGVNNYTRVRDTYLETGSSISNATDNQLRWKTDNRDGLIAFDEIFVDGVLAGSTIASARLELHIQNSNSAGSLIEVAISWADTVTDASFGVTPGVDAADLGVTVNPVPMATGVIAIDVTASLARWSLDPQSNQGWIVIADSGGGDTTARSSDDLTVANRPRLVVTYFP